MVRSRLDNIKETCAIRSCGENGEIGKNKTCAKYDEGGWSEQLLEYKLKDENGTVVRYFPIIQLSENRFESLLRCLKFKMDGERKSGVWDIYVG